MASEPATRRCDRAGWIDDRFFEPIETHSVVSISYRGEQRRDPDHAGSLYVRRRTFAFKQRTAANGNRLREQRALKIEETVYTSAMCNAVVGPTSASRPRFRGGSTKPLDLPGTMEHYDRCVLTGKESFSRSEHRADVNQAEKRRNVRNFPAPWLEIKPERDARRETRLAITSLRIRDWTRYVGPYRARCLAEGGRPFGTGCARYRVLLYVLFHVSTSRAPAVENRRASGAIPGLSLSFSCSLSFLLPRNKCITLRRTCDVQCGFLITVACCTWVRVRVSLLFNLPCDAWDIWGTVKMWTDCKIWSN